MALGIYFVHEGFTPEKYDSAIKQLEAAGAGKPKGRTYHCALESDGMIQVFDIWESQADFDALADADADPRRARCRTEGAHGRYRPQRDDRLSLRNSPVSWRVHWPLMDQLYNRRSGMVCTPNCRGCCTPIDLGKGY